MGRQVPVQESFKEKILVAASGRKAFGRMKSTDPRNSLGDARDFLLISLLLVLLLELGYGTLRFFQREQGNRRKRFVRSGRSTPTARPSNVTTGVPGRWALSVPSRRMRSRRSHPTNSAVTSRALDLRACSTKGRMDIEGAVCANPRRGRRSAEPQGTPARRPGRAGEVTGRAAGCR